MSRWSSTIYLQFPNEAVARAMAEQLGAQFPENGTIPTGSENYALRAPIDEYLRQPVSDWQDGRLVVTDPGEARAGYWAMLRFNTEWPGYEAAMGAIGPFVQVLDHPCNSFA